MNMGGRWIPIEVANHLVLLWAIEVILVVVLLLWLRRQKRSPRSNQDKNTAGMSRKKIKARRK
ncbi:hypothetical protein SAMN05192549_11752 [Duganella sacchari]|uniref:Uncharacterized protein n=1 Tax=Duganella sacchari TaxID=551987 RepID=A0A1M7RBU8_9BURK|nr:hypothetical protein SAMN05192549_11752 [Duganella sacchari]